MKIPRLRKDRKGLRDAKNVLKSLRPGSNAELFVSRTRLNFNSIRKNYMKSSASESIWNASISICNRLSRSSRLVRPGVWNVERFWIGFDSDAEPFTAGYMHKS